jgi:phenylalanyl-tRNA synthetase beta chain
MRRMGIDAPEQKPADSDLFADAIVLLTPAGETLGTLGAVHPKILKMIDVDAEVCFAELNWQTLLHEAQKNKVAAAEIARFPEVKRDLALLIDRDTTFAEIEKTAFACERRLLKRVTLFDVYEGDTLPQGKKSYAVSFYLQDADKTLAEKQIDAIMTKIRSELEDKLNASLR